MAMTSWGKTALGFIVKMPETSPPGDSTVTGESSSFQPATGVSPDIQAAAEPDSELERALKAKLEQANPKVWQLLELLETLADAVPDPTQRLKAALKVSKLTPADVVDSVEFNIRILEAENARVKEQYEQKVADTMAHIDAEAASLQGNLEEAKAKVTKLEDRIAMNIRTRSETATNLASTHSTWVATVDQIRGLLEQVRGIGA
jgi:hypothetical protein